MVPDLYVERFTCITPQVLTHFGIRGILIDLDETLVGHGIKEPTEEAKEWLDGIIRAGFRVCIVSNNTKARTLPFACKSGVCFLSRAHKPQSFRVYRAMCALNLLPHETVFIGDQLSTDMKVAEKLKMHAFLVDPIKGVKRHFFVDIRRALFEENVKKTFRKGIYYDRDTEITEKA